MRIVALGPIGRGIAMEAFGSEGVTLGLVAKIEPGVAASERDAVVGWRDDGPKGRKGLWRQWLNRQFT